MSDTCIHRGHSNHSQKYHKSTGNIGGKSVGFDSKWKPLFIVFIILGLIGLGAAACGVAGMGAQHHWWSAGLFNQLNQTQSLILILVGGIGGTGFLIFGIVGIVKIRKTQQHAFHFSSNDVTTHNSITHASTSSSATPLNPGDTKVSEQHVSNSQKDNHSEQITTTSVTPTGNSTQVSHSSTKRASDHSSSNDVTTHNSITHASTSSSATPLNPGDTKVSEQYVSNSQKNNHSEEITTTSVTPTGNSTQVSHSSIKRASDHSSSNDVTTHNSITHASTSSSATPLNPGDTKVSEQYVSNSQKNNHSEEITTTSVTPTGNSTQVSHSSIKRASDHSSSNDVTTHNSITHASTSSSAASLNLGDTKVSEQHVSNSQKNNHSEEITTTSVTPTGNSTQVSHSSTKQASEISGNKIKQEKKETTNRTGQICITTQTGGYIGHPSKRQLLPHYLADMTLENGSPLPLDDEDFFCEVYLFNGSSRLENTGIPSTMYLPGTLFKGKKDGDSIRLKYKSKLIELTIEQQNHGLKFAKGSFEKVFAMQTIYIKEFCDLINPLFSIYDPYWFYRLGDKGVVYKLETYKAEDDLAISYLKDGVSEDFRPKIDPARAPGAILLSEDKTELIFLMEFCRFQSQDFDIVLNETHLIIYGRFENRPLSCGSIDLNQTDIKQIDGSRDEWQKALSCSREAMFACSWDKMKFFKGRSVEAMKTIMKKSTLLNYRGLLRLNIPLL
jgi:hypothetical protein